MDEGDTSATVWVEPAAMFTVANMGGGATATLLLKGRLNYDHEATSAAHVMVADVDDVPTELSGLATASR